MNSAEVINILKRAEAQLQPIIDEYDTLWPAWQNDDWDWHTNFIYWESITSYKELKRVSRNQLGWHPDYQQIRKYAIARWYNHRVSCCVEWIFRLFPEVKPEEDKKHRTIDFYLNGTPIDLKVTGLPPRTTLAEAQALSSTDLLKLYYDGQSRGRRNGNNNRLILAVVSASGITQNWKLKNRFAEMYLHIVEYMSEFTIGKLVAPAGMSNTRRDVLLVII